jgi:hypothetical protein
VTLSPAVGAVLLEAITEEDLAHLLASKRARHQIPTDLARELADEMAEIMSAPDLETEVGPIPNLPTIGWWRKRAQRIEAAA